MVLDRRTFFFGPFMLREGRLWRDQRPVSPPLTARQRRALVYFLERSGRLLGKDELMEALFPNLEPRNLNVVVDDLRQRLDDRKEPHRFIDTERSLGFRFLADVRIAEPGVGLDLPSATAITSLTESTRERIRASVVAPVPGQACPHTVPLEGHVDFLPSGWQLWAVKEPHPGNFHPDRGPFFLNTQGQFRGMAFIGNEQRGADQGRLFRIHIVACPMDIGSEFTRYIDSAHLTGNWVGMNSLYGGVIVATVEVVRRDA